jgi:hypothetical protein
MSYYLHWHNLRYEAHNLRYEANKRAERALMWLVWRLPRKVVMWSTVRVIANATTGEYQNQIVPDLTALEALKRWDS